MAKPRRDKRQTRWLARRDGVDFGPFKTEQIVQMIDKRELDLGAMLCDVADRRWEPLGSYAEFRAEYAKAEERWAAEAAERHERKLRAKRRATRSAWLLGILATIALLSFGGWMTWRMSRVLPSQALQAFRVPQPPSLPAMPIVKEPDPLKIPQGTKVRRMREPGFYDTSGVGIEGQTGTLVNTMSFASDAEELSDAALDKVVSSARAKLLRCAQAAANRSEAFSGTRVSFVVRSGNLGAFTVGAGVAGDLPFKACVKQALKQVSVPTFGGSQRKVTIPLSIRR